MSNQDTSAISVHELSIQAQILLEVRIHCLDYHVKLIDVNRLAIKQCTQDLHGLGQSDVDGDRKSMQMMT